MNQTNNKIKIVVYSPRMLETGGIESHLMHFCYNMSVAGFDILFWSPDSRMTQSGISELNKYCSKVLLGKGLPWYLWILDFMRVVRFGSTRYYTNGQGSSIFLFSLLFPVKWIHHHHTSGEESDIATWPKLYKYSMHKCDFLVATSPSVVNSLSVNLNREVEFIPCFSRDVFPIVRGIGRIRKIGYFGRLIREKGIQVLLDLAKHPDFESMEFHIWGQGPHYTESDFNSLSNVFFHGKFSTNEEFEVVLNMVDCFVMISTHEEGLPISLIEVSKAGIPWLVSSKGGCNDLVVNKKFNRIINPLSTLEEIREELLDLLCAIEEERFLPISDFSLEINKLFSTTNISLRWRDLIQ